MFSFRVQYVRVGIGLLVCAFIILAGCGGGGGGGDQGVVAPPVTPADSIPPTVMVTSPENGVTGVAVTSVVTASFSEPMAAGTVTTASFSVKDHEANTVLGNVNFSGVTATFTPASNLAYTTSYTATITSAAKDVAGNPLAGDYSWTFITGDSPDTVRPTITSTAPADGAMNVPLNATVTVIFSEPIDPSTVTGVSFTVRDSLNQIVSGTQVVAGASATFTPSLPFTSSTQYTVIVSQGVSDLSGNSLGAQTSWSFTTAALHSVTVIRVGTGGGTVTSAPNGIQCGSDCTEVFELGAQVFLSATPDANSVFEGFGGDCESIVTSCSVSVTATRNVTAVFNTAGSSVSLNQLGFDGIDDVAVQNPTSAPPASLLDATRLTVEAWIFPLTEREMIVAADSSYYLMIRPKPLRIELAVMTSAGVKLISFAGSANPLQLNQWNHVVGMIDDFAGTIRTAVNGELSGSLSLGGAVSTQFNQSFSVGNSYPSYLGHYPFAGRIDEVRLSSVIRYTTNFSPSSLLDPDGATVGHWHFDEAPGATRFADVSGNGQDLFAFNGASIVSGTRDVTASTLSYFQSIYRIQDGIHAYAGKLALGDFNNDGVKDIAWVPALANAMDMLWLFLGTTDGNFASPLTYQTGGAGGKSIVAADINKDGNLDLVVSHRSESEIGVLLGDGRGAFGTPRHVSLSSGPGEMVVGDLNRDGSLDLVVTHWNASVISVLLGDGLGAFGNLAVYPLAQPTLARLGDLNHDGVLDMVANTISLDGSSQLSVFLGTGVGTFTPPISYGAGTYPSDFAIHDFNRDGNLDIAMVSQSAGAGFVVIRPGNGNGLFGPETTYPTGVTAPSAMEVGDFNHDSIGDVLVTAGGGNSQFAIILGKSDGSLDRPTIYENGGGDYDLAIGDMNGDGKDDAIFAVSSSIMIMLGR